MVELIKRMAMREVIKKAKELKEKGNTTDQIIQKFWKEQKVVDGMNMLGVTKEELKEMIDK